MLPIQKNLTNRRLVKNLLPTFIDEIQINAAKKEAVVYNQQINPVTKKRDCLKIRTTKVLDEVTGEKHFFLNEKLTFFEHELFWR
jgi:hypothetical protein